MRSPQLAHKNKLAAKGIGGVKQLCPGRWPVLTWSPLAGFEVITEAAGVLPWQTHPEPSRHR
jgi:hypothetical protein